MLKLFSALKRLFIFIFSEPEIQYIDLLEEYEEYISGIDLRKRDTLVGTLRNVKQYAINYDKLFYHVPEFYVIDPQSVEYVALYRSKNLFAYDSGVMHIGRVTSCSRVKRGDIKEIPSPYSTEIYYRFDVDEWITLDKTVKARESGPHVCYMTSKFLVETSRFCNEFYIADNDEYKLHLGLLDIVAGVYDGFFVKDSKVRVLRKKIIVTTPKGKNKYKIKEYKSAPIGILKIISGIVFDKTSPL